MGKSSSAEKRARKSREVNVANASIKTAYRTLVRNFTALLDQEPAEAEKTYPAVAAALDRAAQRGIIHANTAARKKSRLAHRLKARLAEAAATADGGA
jgi:small subunit ribosomal protein S20